MFDIDFNRTEFGTIKISGVEIKEVEDARESRDAASTISRKNDTEKVD